MATLDPTVFNRHRETIDELTDAAHRLVQQLDDEIDCSTGAAQGTLQHFRNQIAAVGLSLDLSDPNCAPDDGTTAAAWLTLKEANIDRTSAHWPD